MDNRQKTLLRLEGRSMMITELQIQILAQKLTDIPSLKQYLQLESDSLQTVIEDVRNLLNEHLDLA